MTFLSELRSAFRSLRRARAFSAGVVAMLALGIGGTTAVFSAVSHVVLKPLPYAEPGAMVRVYQGDSEGTEQRRYVTGFLYGAIAERATSLESVAAAYTYREMGADVVAEAGPVRLSRLPVTAGYFDVLRVAPRLGRNFTPAEELSEAPVAMISHEMWQRHFSGSASVLGTEIRLNGQAFTVIGVAPPALEDPVVDAVDLWTPWNPMLSAHPHNHQLTVLARLRPGITLEGAREELRRLDAALAEAEPLTAGRPAVLVQLHHDTVSGAARTLYVLLGAVGLVLLLVCVNIASLLLAQATRREREFAVRSALGAGRPRLVRELLAESLALGLVGGAAGVLLGRFVLDALIYFGAGSVPRLAEAHFDLRVLAFAAVTSIGAALLFGIVPALRASRAAADGVLRQRSATAGRRTGALRSALVSVQVALAFMLLAGAAVLSLSFQRLMNVDLGVEDAGVVTFEVHLPDVRYDASRRARFHEELASRLAGVPGISSAGAVSRLPATGQYHPWGVVPASGPRNGLADAGFPAENRVVAGNYFDVMGIRLLRGRGFEARDDAASDRVVVISARAATQAFGDADPIGQRLTVLGDTVSVVGIVSDVALTVEGQQDATVYHAHAQFAANRNWPLVQVLRAGIAPEAALATARSVLQSLDSELVLHRPAPFRDIIGRGVAQRRFTTWLMAGFAGLAVMLALLGLFGLVMFTVRQRRRELGIRIALGARSMEIGTMVVSQGLRIAAVGIVAGLAGALALGRVLAALVFQTQTADPLVLAAAAAGMAAVACLAAYIPAREATRVDPRAVLQQE